MKRLLTILFLSFIVNYSFAQVKVNSEGDIIPTGIYPAVKSNNLKGTIHQFKSIVDRNALPANFRDTGMIAYVRDSAKYYYLYNGITNADWRDLFKTSSALTSGLTSTGDITLVDSTLTINDTIRYTINGVDYIQTVPSTFIINSADSGYYRKDLIYADATGLYKIVGVPNMIFGVKPKLPVNAIEITTVDIYGQQIATPVPVIITPIPNLQQVTNAGNSTTNPIFISSNSIQTPLRITSDFNRSNYLYFKNRSNGNWANTGFLFKNDVSDDAGNEWSGHWFRLMQGSTNSDMIKDGAILMTNGSGGMKIVSDSGRITFNSGSPAYPYDTTSHPYKEMGAFETDGSFRLNKYKNNATLDSVLAPDENGLLVLKKVSVGDIDVLQNTIDSSSFGIKKLDGTVKNVVVYADGLTGVSGGGTQVNSDWNATSGVAEILNKPTIPAQFNPIAGTNMSVSGTYPNITFSASGGSYTLPTASTTVLGGVKVGTGLSIDGSGVLSATGGGGTTYYANNGLTKVAGDTIQLGGTLNKNTTILTGTNTLAISGSIPPFGTYPLTLTNTSGGNAFNISTSGFGNAVNISSTSGYAVSAVSTTGITINAQSSSTNSTMVVINNGTDGTGISASSSTGAGGIFSSSTGTPLKVQTSNTDFSSVLTGINMLRYPSPGTAANGMGMSIDISMPSAGNNTFVANRLISKLTDASDANYTSEFSIQGVLTRGTPTTLFTLSGNGSTRLNKYGLGTFTGTPSKQLSITSTGVIIETSQPIITSQAGVPSSTPGKIGDVNIDTTAKKLYIATGNTSSADWTITN